MIKAEVRETAFPAFLFPTAISKVLVISTKTTNG